MVRVVDNTQSPSASQVAPRVTDTRSSGYQIVIRAGAWSAECRAAGLQTETAIAKAFGVSRMTMHLAHGGGACSGKLIAAALATLGPAKFDALFKITAA